MLYYFNLTSFLSIDEMRSLYTGQSLDLYWTYNLICPSIPEYLKMVDKSMSFFVHAQPHFATHRSRNWEALPFTVSAHGGMLHSRL